MIDWGPSIGRWRTKSWQMGDQELTDGMPMVEDGDKN